MMADREESMRTTRGQLVIRGAPTTLGFHVLLYIEDGSWCALALEMDLRGYGDSVENAYRDLSTNVMRQFLFAMKMGKPELLAFEAEHGFFEKFFKIEHQNLLNHIKEPVEEDQVSVEVG